MRGAGGRCWKCEGYPPAGVIRVPVLIEGGVFGDEEDRRGVRFRKSELQVHLRVHVRWYLDRVLPTAVPRTTHQACMQGVGNTRLA